MKCDGGGGCGGGDTYGRRTISESADCYESIDVAAVTFLFFNSLEYDLCGLYPSTL